MRINDSLASDSADPLLSPTERNSRPRIMSECEYDPIPVEEEQEELGKKLLEHTHHPAERWRVMIQDAWEERNWAQRLLMILETPMTILRVLSVPMADEAHWHRYTCCASVASYPLFVLIYLYREQNVDLLGSPLPNVAIAALVGAVLAPIFFFTTKDEHPPRYHLLIGALGFISAAMWMDLIADEIVSLLTVLGQVFSISKDLMGLTVLAWANSIGDLVADITVAKQGRANMATTACFAGPLFNILVGLGVGLLVVLPARGYSYYAGITGTNVISFGFLVLSLLASLLVSVVLRQHVPWQHGLALLALYVLFAVITILHQVGSLPVPNLQP